HNSTVFTECTPESRKNTNGGREICMSETPLSAWTRSARLLIGSAIRPLALCVTLIIVGCSSLSVSAIHDPLYRASPHTSTITDTASDAKYGVSQIRIDVVDGDITPCAGSPFPPNLLPSLIPCRTNAFTVSRTCTFPNTQTQVTCPFPRAL